MVGGAYVASHSRAPVSVIQISPGARTVTSAAHSTIIVAEKLLILLTSESHTRHLSLRPRRAFARRVPSAMLSLSRVARASATGRAAAASVSATRSYHKNVRVTHPPVS